MLSSTLISSSLFYQPFVVMGKLTDVGWLAVLWFAVSNLQGNPGFFTRVPNLKRKIGHNIIFTSMKQGIF